jgi:hypothetical protein
MLLSKIEVSTVAFEWFSDQRPKNAKGLAVCCLAPGSCIQVSEFPYGTVVYVLCTTTVRVDASGIPCNSTLWYCSGGGELPLIPPAHK